MLVVNDSQFANRAEIIWEKGTNRSAFFRGEVNKYSWVDIGSSFLPSEIIAAFLWAQLENIEFIQKERKIIWNHYFSLLMVTGNKNKISLPKTPNYASNNAHMFYLLCNDLKSRSKNFLLQNIDKPDDELLFALILKNLSDRQISIDKKLIDYIIKRIDRSYGKIVDFIYKIDEVSLKKKRSINLSTIKEVLGE